MKKKKKFTCLLDRFGKRKKEKNDRSDAFWKKFKH